MAFGGMDDEGDVNKTIGFDYLDEDDNAAQTITAQGTAAETIMPVQGGNETVLQTGEQSAAFPVTQAPPAPKSKMPLVLGLVGGAALVGGNLLITKRLDEANAAAQQEKLQREADLLKKAEQERLAQEAEGRSGWQRCKPI